MMQAVRESEMTKHTEKPTIIGIDADDTLWQSEHFFKLTEAYFKELLADHADPLELATKLLATERRNLQFYGYGIKGFMLSMIDTAIDVTEGRVPANVIQKILNAGRDMLNHPVVPLPDVQETLESLARDFHLVMITKGDLFDQERKLAASGLGELFHAIEIVSDKTSQTYTRIFNQHGQGPTRAAMVGNSLKSDIMPALEAGSWAIFVPHELTWEHEHVDPPTQHPRFQQIESFASLPKAIAKM
jgi:putative hydrolase of the HAD superfamily